MNNKPRTLKAIKNDPRVESIADERCYGNGYWVWLKEGFIFADMECGSAHEMTVRDLCAVFQSIEAI